MKAIIILLVVGGAVLGVVYFMGGYSSFDPTEQGEKAKAAIKTGMSLKQVLDVAGDKPKYRPINMMKIAKDLRAPQAGEPVDFVRSRVEGKIADGEMPNGFILQYRFSDQCAFDVTFNAAGNVVGVADIATMADLLGTRQRDDE